MCRDTWIVRWLRLLGLAAGLLGLVPLATGEEFTPQAHQFDLTLENVSGFVARTSQIHVRENTLAGRDLSQSSNGVKRLHHFL